MQTLSDCLALVPIKSLDTGKTRLSAILEPHERAALIPAMAEDVLNAFADFARMPVLVITGDPRVAGMAAARGFYSLMETTCVSETAAIESATRRAHELGAGGTLVVPADIPLVQAEDLAAVLKLAPQQGCLLAPAWDGRGTNAVLRRPHDLFPLRFGNDSFVPHRTAAEKTGLACAILHNERLALDVDSPEDLFRFLEYPSTTMTRRVLESFHLERRLQ
jgi:2-phospho-L-lactate guanylyltransferase